MAARGEISWSAEDRWTAVIAAVLLALLALTSLHSYLLFHTLAESLHHRLLT